MLGRQRVERPYGRLGLILSLLVLAACVRITPPVPDPTPTPTPDPTPSPSPTPPPSSSVPHEGEWLVTFTPAEGEGFVHALQVTTDVSTEGLVNAGGGLQERCAKTCGAAQADGFGFMGELLLSDGTAVLALAIFSQTADPGSTSLSAYTTSPITIIRNETGQETFTSAAAWAVSDTEVVEGTVTGTNIGEARALGGFGLINIGQAVEMLREAAYY